MNLVGLPNRRATGLSVNAPAVLAGLLAGAGASTAPPHVTLAAIFGMTVIVLVALHPPFGAYLLLATTPLLAGMDRGLLLPLLRPHEAIAALITAGLLVHLAVGAASRAQIRLRVSPGPIDRAILLMALASSVLPLIVMTLRERPIIQEDVLYALLVWKYYAVYLIVRACALTLEHVRRCLWIVLGAAAVVALVAIMQVLHVPAIEGLIADLYVPEGVNHPSTDRGTSTLASSIAVGDVMVFSLAVAGGLLVSGDRRRLALTLVSILFVFGTVATGQFSAIIALVIGILAFGWITKRLSGSIIAFAPVAGVAALLLRPVIDKRLSSFSGGSSLPPSWQARLDNVTTIFWPVLEVDGNWLTGVQPLARVDGPLLSGIEFIWIESGYVYLLWTGGVAFAAAFLWFIWVGLRSIARIARARQDAVGAAAAASFTTLIVTFMLMAVDPHLTLRGSADLSFALLALALAAPVEMGRRAARPKDVRRGDADPGPPPPDSGSLAAINSSATRSHRSRNSRIESRPRIPRAPSDR